MEKPTDFKWKHFEPEIILWGVRWYCQYAISYRDFNNSAASGGDFSI